jgi:hypothetical protein
MAKRSREQTRKNKSVSNIEYLERWRRRRQRAKRRGARRRDRRKEQKGLKHDYPKKRRGFLIERLPLHVQMRVFEGYGSGESYQQISAALATRGYKVSEECLSRYWRRVWHEEFNTLRLGWVVKEFLKKALTKSPKSSNAKMAEELLYTAAVMKVKQLKEEPPVALMKEGREQGKAAGREAEPEGRKRRKSPVVQAREIRRRWRELYGLEENTEAEGDKENT